jgi:type III pantothenate kinase
MDVGNSHMVLGMYRPDDAADNSELLAHWRVMTTNYRTTDEVRMLLTTLFQQEGIRLDSVTDCCVSSVVPQLNFSLEKACREAFGLDPLFVGPGVRTGLVIQVENPKEVGADRIVNAVGALAEYGGPLIVVDFGTATTIDAITAQSEYIGGVIVPGIQISADALFEKCAKLPRIEIAKPPSVIGKDTVAHMRSGLTYGYADLVDGLIGRVIGEMGGSPQVIATGGFASLIAGIAKRIDRIDPMLTLKGLRAVYIKNTRMKEEA